MKVAGTNFGSRAFQPLFIYELLKGSFLLANYTGPVKGGFDSWSKLQNEDNHEISLQKNKRDINVDQLGEYACGLACICYLQILCEPELSFGQE